VVSTGIINGKIKNRDLAVFYFMVLRVIFTPRRMKIGKQIHKKTTKKGFKQ